MLNKEGIKKVLKNKLILVIFSFILGVLTTILISEFTYFYINIRNDNKDDFSITNKSSLKESIDKIYDAVVLIQSYSTKSLENTGTGFIYKKDKKYAYILTNEHVISEGEDIKVTLVNDEVLDARVLGKDEYLDIAVLRIDKKYAPLIATTSSSENVNLGDTVFTVGSPLGENYRGSVTAGIISGKNRTVPISISGKEEDWVMQVLQVDASINPGNSGGPLLNAAGEVIGICTMKLVDNNIEGMGFALPIEYAINNAVYLEKGEKIKWPSLGIEMINVNDTAKLVRNNLVIPNNISKGIVIKSVEKESIAARSNLKVGDIIIKINDNDISDMAFFKYELYKYKQGNKISLTIIRNKKEKKIKVQL